MATIGVVPAAGHAVRLQPLDCSKEVLRIAGKPVIEYLVERMRAGGCTELRIVTRPEKADVIEYAERAGAEVVLAHPPTINASFVAGLGGLEPDDIALLGFPDSLWEPLDGYARLVEEVEQGREVALGMFDVPGIPGSDYLGFDADGRLAEFHIKPANPPSSWIWGCAAARVRALAGLGDREWPSQHMEALLHAGVDLVGVRLSREYVDIGTHESLEAAPRTWPAAPVKSG